MRFETLLSSTALAVALASPALAAVVPGKAFNRAVQIWLENTNFNPAKSDARAYSYSQPNYIAAVSGEYFGMDSDDTVTVPANVSTVVDLLEDKGISWAEYQEDMPFTGFLGSSFANPATGADAYRRKHNPLISYASVNENAARLANIKNFTVFEQDLAANQLPQWIFITPNMTNDAHDTDITFAGNWVKNFLTPLLSNPNFNDDKTLIILTFDEVASTIGNRVFALVLGNALPSNLIGTTDENFYTHYSTIATVSANWGLHTLGRWDTSNVLAFVAALMGDKLRKTTVGIVTLVLSYAGIFHSLFKANMPVPNTDVVVNGRTVLPVVVAQWGSQVKCTPYTGQLVPPSLFNPPSVPSGC